MKVTNNFDSGSIEIIDASDIQNIRLKLATDNKSNTRQWFHFSLETTVGKPHTITITNAGNSSFPNAWKGYQVLGSYDQKNWFRVTTDFNGQQLVFSHTPQSSTISFAYFIPYSYERHQNLITAAKESPLCRHTVLGFTGDNHPIDLLTFGNEEPTKQKIWLIARQHPGETMAQWFIEGVLTRLLSNDKVANSLLKSSVFYIVPNMNPDGSIRGNHRTNSHGVNLNRQWENPCENTCPEVFYVRQAMHNIGVDFFLDIHGDEEIPYCFIIGGDLNCSITKQANIFKQNLTKASKDFQHAVDYDTFDNGQPSCCSSNCGESSLNKASSYVQDKFNCLSLTLEMPFIDNANNTAPDTGWSSERSIALGQSLLEPILQWRKN